MTQEERTRDEVLNCLVANTQALTLLVADLLARRKHPVSTEAAYSAIAHAVLDKPETLGPPLSNPAEMNPGTQDAAKPRKPRAPKAEAPAAPPPPITNVTPVVPSKTAADLKEALQACLAKHGMQVTKERLAPHAKLSDVPDADIEATIARLSA